MGINYSVTIKTGDIKDAGTNANVYIRIIGDLGSTEQKNLDKPGYDDFERNDLDTYDISSEVNIGIPEQVVIGHDDDTSKAGWYLDWVKVKDPDTHKEYTFNCYNWIDSKKLEHILDRADGVPKPEFEVKDRLSIPLGKDYKILDWRDSEVDAFQEKVIFTVQSAKSETGEVAKMTENSLSTEVSVGGGTTVQVSAKVAAELRTGYSERSESNTSLTTSSAVEHTFTPRARTLLFFTINWQRIDEVGKVRRGGREFPYRMTTRYTSSGVRAESYKKGETLPPHVLNVINNNNLASEYKTP